MPLASPPGVNEIIPVTGLAPDTTYHFALVVLDEAAGASPLSNVASAGTQDVSLR